MNYYSYVLIIMVKIIFSIVIMYLNMINNKNYCILLNCLLMISMYSDFNSMNLMFLHFMFVPSMLLIFYMNMKWGFGEFRFNSSI